MEKKGYRISIFLHSTTKTTEEIAILLSPFINKWFDKNFEEVNFYKTGFTCTISEKPFCWISISVNSSYKKGSDDSYDYNHEFAYIDDIGLLTNRQDYIKRISEILMTLWLNNIPTYCFEDEELPFNGGAYGPIPHLFVSQ